MNEHVDQLINVGTIATGSDTVGDSFELIHYVHVLNARNSQCRSQQRSRTTLFRTRVTSICSGTRRIISLWRSGATIEKPPKKMAALVGD